MLVLLLELRLWQDAPNSMRLGVVLCTEADKYRSKGMGEVENLSLCFQIDNKKIQIFLQ